MRSDEQRITDAMAAAKAVMGYVRAEPSGERASPQLLDAVFFNIVVLGEAVRGLLAGDGRTEDAKIVEAHPEIPWRDWLGMRNIITHQYYRRDWRVVCGGMPSPANSID